MNQEEKIDYLKKWAADNKCYFENEGEIGFGRKCVGIVKDGHYVEYGYPDDGVYEYDFEIPEDAYHKGPYLAVLGRSDDAIDQLYEWVKSIEQAGYIVYSGPRIIPADEDPIQTMITGLQETKLVKKETTA